MQVAAGTAYGLVYPRATCHVTTLLVLISGNLKSKSDSQFVVNVPPSVFYFVLFFVFVWALPLPTNYLNMIVDVVPVSSKALIGTTVPSLFFVSTIMSAVYFTGTFS
jgi:hypothetical protein